jgi:hypothetical protein
MIKTECAPMWSYTGKTQNSKKTFSIPSEARLSVCQSMILYVGNTSRLINDPPWNLKTNI